MTSMPRRTAALAATIAVTTVAVAAPPDWFVRRDRDGNGILSREEFPSASFARLDRNGDGFLSQEEVGSPADVASVPTVANVRSVVDRDLPYRDDLPGVDPRRVSLDIHRPAAADGGPRPVLVMIHGGGWRAGDKAAGGVVAPKAPWLIAEGWIMVSVNYRLSPAVQHPAHVDDVAHAIAWVGREIGRFGGDPERLVLMGHSAGAHLAALAAADAERLRAAGGRPESIRGVVLLDGAGYDIPLRMRNAGAASRSLFTNAFGSDPAGWADASPAEHLRRRASGGPADGGDEPTPGNTTAPPPPPLLILHIDRTVAATQVRVLADAARAAGGTAEVHRFPGETHASINRRLGEPGHDPTIVTGGFLRRILTPPTPPASEGPIFDAPPDRK
jgi:arylformamidase